MATAKVIIAGQNNIGPAVKSVQGDISSLSNVAQKAGDTLKKAFTITALVASLKKFGDACVSCFNDFWEAERKYKQLQIALGDTKAYVKVTDTIASLNLMGWQPFARMIRDEFGQLSYYGVIS